MFVASHLCSENPCTPQVPVLDLLCGPRMVPPPLDKEQMYLNLPQAEIRVLFFNVIKELKNNVISLSQLSTLPAILEMWGLKEVLPVPFLSFFLTPKWLTKFLI